MRRRTLANPAAISSAPVTVDVDPDQAGQPARPVAVAAVGVQPGSSRVQPPTSTTSTPAASSWERTPAPMSRAGVPVRETAYVAGTTAGDLGPHRLGHLVAPHRRRAGRPRP